VHAERTVEEERIRSAAELRLEGEMLCRCEMHAVVGDRSALPAVSPRRVPIASTGDGWQESRGRSG
jgi:hypothetical protein